MSYRIAVIGAGNGGKAAAADLALRGHRVRLFEFAEYASNIESLARSCRLAATGQVQGVAELESVGSDLVAAAADADVIIVATQALTHSRVARELAGIVRPDQIVVVNPGSTCGSLQIAREWRRAGLANLPLLAETSTLTYGCRAQAESVHVGLRVKLVTFGMFPGCAMAEAGPKVEAMFSVTV